LLILLEKLVDVYFAVIPRQKPCCDTISKVHFIAHRGAHNNARGVIENTLEAFRLAKDLGCWGIEFDVRTTVDGVLVVNHDATLNRLWGLKKSIADLSFQELRKLVPKVPTLAEVVAEFGGRMHLFIELKAPFHDENRLVQDLQGLSAKKEYHLLALSNSIFYSLSQFPKDSLLLVPVHNNVHEFCELSLNENYGGVLGHYLLLNNKLIHKLKAAGQISGVGFVNSKYSLYRELNRGINWIFTNNAMKLSHYLQ